MVSQATQRIKSWFGALVVAGLVGNPALTTNAWALEASATNQSHSRSSSLADSSALPDGVYLYGESPEPDQIGASYLAFEVQGNQVIGAFYLPRSSFDCFQGEFQGDHLSLRITDSYSQTVHNYAIAVQTDNYLASAEPIAASTQLEGYDSIPTISENDRRMLETCQADFQTGS